MTSMDFAEDDEDVIYDKANLVRHNNRRTGNFKQRSLLLLSLAFIFICLGLSMGILGPTLPCLETLTNAREDQASLVFSGRAVGSLGGWLLSRLLLASLPVSVPAPGLLLAGMTVLGLANLALPWPRHIWWLMPAFALQGGAMAAVETGGLAVLQSSIQARNTRCHNIVLFMITLGCTLGPLFTIPLLDTYDCKPGDLAVHGGNSSRYPILGPLPSLSRRRRLAEEELFNASEYTTRLESERVNFTTTLQPTTTTTFSNEEAVPQRPHSAIPIKPGITDGKFSNQQLNSADGSITANKVKEMQKEVRLKNIKTEPVITATVTPKTTLPPIIATTIDLSNTTTESLVTLTLAEELFPSDSNISLSNNDTTSTKINIVTKTEPISTTSMLKVATVTTETSATTLPPYTSSLTNSKISETMTYFLPAKTTSAKDSIHSSPLLIPSTAATTHSSLQTTTFTTPGYVPQVTTAESSYTAPEATSTSSGNLKPRNTQSPGLIVSIKNALQSTQKMVDRMLTIQKIYVLLGGISLLVTLLSIPVVIGRFWCCCGGPSSSSTGGGSFSLLDNEAGSHESGLNSQFALDTGTIDYRDYSVHSWAAHVTLGQGVGLALLGLTHMFYAGMEVTFGGFLFSYAVRYLKWSKLNGLLVTFVFWSCILLGRFTTLSRCWTSRTIWLHILATFVASIVVTSTPAGPWFWVATASLGLTLSGLLPALLSWSEHAYRPSAPPVMVPQIAARIGEMFLPVLTGYLHRVTMSSAVLVYLTLACMSVTTGAFLGLSLLAGFGRLTGGGSRAIRRPPADFVEGLSDEEAAGGKSGSFQFTKMTSTANIQSAAGQEPAQGNGHLLPLIRNKKRRTKYTLGKRDSMASASLLDSVSGGSSDEDELGL